MKGHNDESEEARLQAPQSPKIALQFANVSITKLGDMQHKDMSSVESEL